MRLNHNIDNNSSTSNNTASNKSNNEAAIGGVNNRNNISIVNDMATNGASNNGASNNSNINNNTRSARRPTIRNILPVTMQPESIVSSSIDFVPNATFLLSPPLNTVNPLTLSANPSTSYHNEIVSGPWIRPPLTRLISNTSSEEEFDIAERQDYLTHRFNSQFQYTTPAVPISGHQSNVSRSASQTRNLPMLSTAYIPRSQFLSTEPTSMAHEPVRPHTNGYHVPPIQSFRDTFAPSAFLYPPGFPHRRLASQMLTETNFQMSRSLNLLYQQLNEIVSIHSRLHPGNDIGFAHELPYEFLNIITSCFGILLHNYHQHRNM